MEGMSNRHPALSRRGNLMWLLPCKLFNGGGVGRYRLMQHRQLHVVASRAGSRHSQLCIKGLNTGSVSWHR
jgi:hypothetical protein